MKIWVACLLGACAFSALFVKLEIRRSSFTPAKGSLPSPNIDRSLSLLYMAGKSGKISFSPGEGYSISWRMPGEMPPSHRPAPQEGAVSYGFSGGRLGDNLLSYLHARWIAYRDNVPLVFKPFPYAEEFVLSNEPHPLPTSSPKEIPYFPEPSIKHRDAPFTVDWEDAGFREEISLSLMPATPRTLLSLPPGKISVCVHVRQGGSFDLPIALSMHPLKFPSDRYYIEQIRRIAHLFDGQPMYVFLMTDDLHPERLLERYKRALPQANIEWACRIDKADHTLDDFFSIPKFDCLIRGDSNFSLVASKLSEYAIQITPTHYRKKKGKFSITGIEISFNPSYKKNLARKEKILIGGICRNTANAVSNVIRNAESLGNHFADYAVLIYENNSTDSTAALFSEWAKQNPKVLFVSETLDDLPLSRTERIAQARNKVLSLARKPEYADFKYFVMVDLDFSTPWPAQRIVQWIERGGDWDCISANGIHANGEYYDRYAHRDMERPFGPELLGEWWQARVVQHPLFLSRQGNLIPVFSAFGGLAIYKTASLLHCAYSGTVTRGLQKYYAQILSRHPNGKSRLRHPRLHALNPQINEYARQLGFKPLSRFKLKSVPIVFVENTAQEHPDGFRHPTCCEHIPLHASMATHGHGKLFIDPEMVFLRY